MRVSISQVLYVSYSRVDLTILLNILEKDGNLFERERYGRCKMFGMVIAFALVLVD
jgi:hypothetical protein